MSKRRKAGDWVWLTPNSGFVGESYRLKAEIQPEDNPPPCMWDCDDEECAEWSTLLTEEDGDRGRHTLCHVSECEMLDEPFQGKLTTYCAPKTDKQGDVRMDTINSHDEPNRTDSLAKVLVAAMEAHPCLRIGQLVWNAAFMARKQSEICSREGNDANVFYITDEALAEGLDMIAREKSLPGDKATQLAERIKSYLTRKTGVMLDDETMDHISKLIRDV